jgi:ATP-dependent helicase/nuclease subunit B
MSVRFIIGRAGSGKTRFCFDAIIDQCRQDPLGPAIFWILPKQATFLAQRQLACESGLPAICRASVFSFNQLSDLIAQHCGGIAIPEINPAGRQMILGRLLRKHQPELRFFRSVARQPGLAAELDSAFAELERYGRSADELLAAWDRPDAKANPLSAKFHDLRLLYGAYLKYLGQDRLDQHRRLNQVLDCIADWPALRDASIYVDGFFEFSQPERLMLAALARGCSSMAITLLMDPASPALRDPRHRPDPMSPFHRTQQTALRLMATFTDQAVPIEAPLLLNKPQQAAVAALRTLESRFFGRGAAASDDDSAIHLIEAPTRRDEIDAVARHIRTLLGEGIRLREIAVLARDLSPYADLINASFAEHEIPCFIDRRRRASHHPLIRFTRLLPTLARGQWPSETIIALLKTRLLPVSAEAADELENYVLEHGVHGKAWIGDAAWSFRRDLTRRDENQSPAELTAIARIDAARRAAVAPLIDLSNLFASPQPLPARQLVQAIRDVFTKARLQQTVARWIAQAEANQALEEAATHEQIWNELIALLDQMAELLDDEPLSPREFAEVLETGLEQFELAIAPPTLDQVLVSSVDRTRTAEIKACILIGWHDGGFPRRPGTGTILADSDREEMSLGGTAERLLLDERLWAYFAITRSTDRLCITRPCSDETGKALAPSVYWARVRELFPDVELTSINRSCEEDCIATPTQLTTALMRWARTPPAEIATDEPWPALYQHVATSPQFDALRRFAWPALRYQNDARLSPAIARQLFTSPLETSIRRIESFAACPFQHFAAHGLALRERGDADLHGGDLSGLYHNVLRSVVDHLIRSGHDWSEPSPRTAGLVEEQTFLLGQRLRNEIMLSSARNRYLLSRAQRTLKQVVATLEASIARGHFRPAKVEQRYGESSPLQTLWLETPEGNRVGISGRIDRIDLLPSGHGQSAAAIDYRSTATPVEFDRVYHGLSLQLLTALLVLQASGQRLVGRPISPAAALYVQLKRQLEDVAHPSEALDPGHPDFDLPVKERGIFDERYLHDLDKKVSPGESSAVIQLKINKDGSISKSPKPDAAPPDAFAALLELVRWRIGETVDRLLGGDIRITPFRLREKSPCADCGFLSVCRFDTRTNRYRMLEPVDRPRVFELALSQCKPEEQP